MMKKMKILLIIIGVLLCSFMLLLVTACSTVDLQSSEEKQIKESKPNDENVEVFLPVKVVKTCESDMNDTTDKESLTVSTYECNYTEDGLMEDMTYEQIRTYDKIDSFEYEKEKSTYLYDENGYLKERVKTNLLDKAQTPIIKEQFFYEKGKVKNYINTNYHWVGDINVNGSSMKETTYEYDTKTGLVMKEISKYDYYQMNENGEVEILDDPAHKSVSVVPYIYTIDEQNNITTMKNEMDDEEQFLSGEKLYSSFEYENGRITRAFPVSAGGTTFSYNEKGLISEYIVVEDVHMNVEYNENNQPILEKESYGGQWFMEKHYSYEKDMVTAMHYQFKDEFTSETSSYDVEIEYDEDNNLISYVCTGDKNYDIQVQYKRFVVDKEQYDNYRKNHYYGYFEEVMEDAMHVFRMNHNIYQQYWKSEAYKRATYIDYVTDEEKYAGNPFNTME